MTATIVVFDASDKTAAKTALETLTVTANDKVVTWVFGTKCYAALVTV